MVDVTPGLAEFVLLRLREEEDGWTSMVDAGGAAAPVASRRLEACRDQILRIESRRLALTARNESWIVPELKALAFPYYDHPDYQPDWYPDRTSLRA